MHHLDQQQVLALSAMILLRNNVAQIVNKLGIVVGSVKQSTGLVIRLDVLTSKRNKKVSSEVVSNLVVSLYIPWARNGKNSMFSNKNCMYQ